MTFNGVSEREQKISKDRRYLLTGTVDGKLTITPATLTVKIANVTKVVVKQFVDSKWVELKSTVNGDGTVTIEGVVEAPMAIFTK